MDAIRKTQSLEEYTWRRLRSPLLLSWITILIFAAMMTLSIVAVIKINQLRSNLYVLKRTVVAAINAADWDLANSHIEVTVSKYNFARITLYSTSDRLIGPIGDSNGGIFEYCSSTAGGALNVSGCTSLINKNELLFLFGFAVVFIVSLFVGILVFRSNNKRFIGDVGRFLRELGSNRGSVNSSQALNSVSELIDLQVQFEKLINEIEKSARLKATADIAASLAHDLRSPLTALRVLAQAGGFDGEKKKLLESAICRTDDLAEKLLMNVKNGVEQVNDTSGSELLRNNVFEVDAIEELFKEKQIEFSKESIRMTFENKVPKKIACVGDKFEVFRVISNILNNGRDAIAGRSNGHLSLVVEPDSEFISFIIRDSGIGIPENKLPELMRVRRSYKAQGNGIGLFNAKRTIEKFGGKISIESVESVGTTVRVILPSVGVNSDV